MVVSKEWNWNSTSVKLSCETNFFLFWWNFDFDENGSLNCRTTHKNYQNLLQKWWFCYSHVSCFKRRLWFMTKTTHFRTIRPTMQAIGKIMKKFEETGVFTIERPVHRYFARSAANIVIINESVAEGHNVSIPRRPQDCLAAHYGVFCI